MTIDKKKILERVKSGISGFDELINGGFFKQTVNVISGESGTGKTIFATQVLYEASKKNRRCLCFMTSESPESLKKEMYSSFRWDLWELENLGLITFCDVTDPELRLLKKIDESPTEFLKTFKKLLSHTIKKIKPDIVFIDSIESMFLAIDSDYWLKTLTDDLFGELRKHNTTSIITVGTHFDIDKILEYCADSATRFGLVVSGNHLQRSIYIAKMRGSGTINNINVLDISDSGIRVLDKSPYISNFD